MIGKIFPGDFMNTEWTSKTIDLDRVFYQLKDSSIFELKRFMQEHDLSGNIDEIKISKEFFHSLSLDIEKFKKEIDEGQKIIIVKSIDGFGPIETERVHWLFQIF